MNIAKNRMFALIAIFLMSSTAVTYVAMMPAAHAQYVVGLPIATYAFIAAEPNPVGVGQNIYLSFGIDKVANTADGAYGDRWTNFTITVTHPDGTKETLTGFTADDTGFAHTIYTPTVLGNYTFMLAFSGQTLTGANPPPGGWGPTTYAQYIGDVYMPSTSSTQTVTVQQQPVEMIPFNPYPTNYWQRPINMMNNNWNTISGNWFGDKAFTNGGYGYNVTGNFDPYTSAPNSAHVLWTTPMAPGGLIGGEYGITANSNFYSTAQYEAKFKAVIMDGVLYYTLVPGASSYYEGTIAMNLRTGQTLWTKTLSQMNGTLRMGWIYNYISPNQYGGLSYLWTVSGTTYSLYDATTGNYILQITGAPSGVTFMNTAPDGALIGYYVNSTGTASSLTCWNASACILAGSSGSNPAYTANGWFWRPGAPTTITWATGIEWSVPIATNISGLSISPTMSINAIAENTLLMISAPSGTYENYQIEAGYSIINGAQLFIVNRTVQVWTRETTTFVGNGYYIDFDCEAQTFTAYSDTTGQQLWTATFPTNTFWGYVSTYTPEDAYGMLYASTYDGHVYAFNDKTGALVWNFYAGSGGYNNVYGSWPLKVIEVVADGKLYLNGGHTYNPPLFRGANLICLNATTGAQIWQIFSFAQSNSPTCAIADGELLVPNSYDNQLYCYGQGQTATTVTTSSVYNNPAQVLVSGTVTDQSPGQTCLGIPAKGTPAISDDSMTAWMEYLYEQQPEPMNATGVPVTLTDVDPNGNTYTIGQTTSDITGHFSYAFSPNVPGVYTIIATFGGSNSYYGSSSETIMGFNQPTTTTTPTATAVTGLATSSDVMYIGVAIIVVIIIIGAVLAVLMMRKRP